MTETDSRLFTCFRAVFPALADEEIPAAAQDTTEQWDSLGTVMLASAVAEEFGIEIDLFAMEQCTSFDRVRKFVLEKTAV